MLLKGTIPVLLFCSIALLPQGCHSASKNTKPSKDTNIKSSRLAGSWYPGDKRGLNKMLSSLLKKSGATDIGKGRVVGLIAPHAGYVYSGRAAARAFKLLSGREIKRVIIIAPTHYGGFRGFSTPDYTHYKTPLGLVPVDKDAVGTLRGHKQHIRSQIAHEQEHSLEIELPFLQYVLKDFEVLPILVGELSLVDIDSISKKLMKFMDRKTVVIVSSDFTHYGERFGYKPFEVKDPASLKEKLKELDLGAVKKIGAIDCEGFRDYVRDRKVTICGRNAIALFLRVLEKRKNAKAKLVEYYNSADISKDYDNTVSYASVVFYEDPKKDDKKPKGELKMDKKTYNLRSEEKSTLLKISRDTLELYLNEGKYPDTDKYELTDNLKAKRGVFVTLHKKGALRGCIGYIEGIKPVYRAVMENTVNAALEDPRFPRVKKEETKDLDIEVSVMTPLAEFKKPDEIEIGRDGLVISKGWHKGLLLPQVATEWKWDRVQFLEAVSNKAGLPRQAWKDEDVKLEKFSAIVFGEKEGKEK